METLSIWITVIFGLFSIGLSVAFFVSAKNAEARTSNLLTQIDSQLNTLQRLSNRWMDKTLDYFTQQKPPTLTEQIEALTILNSQFTLINRQGLQQISETPTREEIITVIIKLCYQTALSNYLASGYLPSISDFNEHDAFHTFIRRTLNHTTSDYAYFSSLLNLVSPDEIAKNALYPTYTETKNALEPYVRDASKIFVIKQNQ